MTQKHTLFAIISSIILLVGCADASQTSLPQAQTEEHADEHDAEMLALPELSPAALEDAPLKAVATTSIIGDVVSQVGGEAINLTTLMSAGQDPHSYQPAARDLTAVSEADVIFVNGWDLEEALVHDLVSIGGDVPMVAISANIEPLASGENGDEHGHGEADPHVWFSVQNVAQWAENAAQVLGVLDPANADIYQSNATAYLADLDALESYAETELATIPDERRYLITNHDSLNYFAHDYDFEVLGTVIPGASTLAEPSAREMAELVNLMEAHDMCTIFTETSVSDTLAQTVAAELDGCDEVLVIPLYTGSLGPSGSGADSYIDMYRANVEVIVKGLAKT